MTKIKFDDATIEAPRSAAKPRKPFGRGVGCLSW